MELKQALENWIYGLLGFEERTFIISRRLAGDVINHNEARLKSTYMDYTEMNEYTFDLRIVKKPLDNNVAVKIDTIVEEDGIISKLLKQYDNCKCEYTGECDYKKEEY